MRRRALRAPALLLALLLLAGCRVPEPETPDVPDEPDVVDTADVPDAPETPDVPDEPDTQPDETPTAPDTPAQTAGGVTVHTDYSGYTPFSAPEALYTRLTDERIADLAPSDDYGALHPFAGTLLYSGDGWLSGAYYGLYDDAGRIVADPTYTSIEQLQDYRAGGFCDLPFWLLGRCAEAEVIEEDGWSYVDGKTVYAVASLDGSFVTPCVYAYVRAIGENVLCRESWDSDTFTIYAPDGTVLMTEQALAGYDLVYNEVCDGGEGRILVECADGWWFLAMDGTRLLGPYEEAEAFYDGCARVAIQDPDFSDIGWRHGAIDAAGNWVVEPEWMDVTTACDLGIIVRNSDSHVCALYGRDGTELFRVTGDYMTRTDYGFCVNHWSGNAQSFLDEAGQELYRTWAGAWSVVDDSGWLVRERADGLELYHVVTGESASFADALHIMPLYRDYMTGQQSELAYYVLSTDGGTVLLDASLREVLALGAQSCYAAADLWTGEEYLVAWDYDNGRVTIRDGALNVLLTLDASRLTTRIVNGIVQTTGTWAETGTALDGRTAFCYPLLGSMDD